MSHQLDLVWDMFLQYRIKLSGWKDLRDRREVDRSRQPHVLGGLTDPQPINNIINVVTNCKLKSGGAIANDGSIDNMSLGSIGITVDENDDDISNMDELEQGNIRERHLSDQDSTSSAMSSSL